MRKRLAPSIVTGVAVVAFLTACSAPSGQASSDKPEGTKSTASASPAKGKHVEKHKELAGLKVRALTEWGHVPGEKTTQAQRIVQVNDTLCILQTESAGGGLSSLIVPCELAQPKR